jgi:N-acetylglucosamine-6-phosphate deacetylase
MHIEILHADALTPSGVIGDSHIVIEDGRIQSVDRWSGASHRPEAQVIDARGLVASPGWIDIQINGGFGMYFTEQPETIWEVAARLPRYGTTGFLPTIVSAPLDIYERAIQVLRQGPPAGWRGAVPLGLHFEGPFLNPAKKGAHNPAFLRAPDLRDVRDWRRDNGVLLVTLAPELPGALELSRALIERGVIVSAGHSAATCDQAEAGFAVGLRAGTHLYNAMPALDHRAPGLTGALLDHPEIVTGLIVDGIHVHPRMVSLAWRLKGANRVALITDAMAALGQPPGRCVFSSQVNVVDQTSARLGDGTLAGSILTQEQALRNVMSFCKVSAADVIPALTQTPADLLRVVSKGRLAPGFDADLTLMDSEGSVRFTLTCGRILCSA